MRGDGRVFKLGLAWWIAYYRNGKEFRERGGTTKTQARTRLNQRRAEIQGGRFVGPERERVTVHELLDALLAHLELKGAKSVVSVRSHLVPVRAWFGAARAVDVTSARVETFQNDRCRANKASATINREVGALRQAFHLARRQGRLLHVPYFPMLTEDNARQGFFEAEEFERVLPHLPEWLADFATFGYITGWRKGEIAALLHRGGVPIREFRKTWATACREVGVGKKHFHDFRRTAARNMVRAGVPQTVAMSITGHKTVSMFNRYSITSQEDRREALRRTAEHVAAAPRPRVARSSP